MKRLRSIALFLAALIGAYFSIGLVLFRLPIGTKQRIEGDVWFKYLDLGDGSLRHWTWEVWPWGSEDLFLVGDRLFRVSKADDRRVWADDPFLLEKRKMTKHVVVTAYPVLIGGYGRADVESILEVPGVPFITK